MLGNNKLLLPWIYLPVILNLIHWNQYTQSRHTSFKHLRYFLCMGFFSSGQQIWWALSTCSVYHWIAKLYCFNSALLKVSPPVPSLLAPLPFILHATKPWQTQGTSISTGAPYFWCSIEGTAKRHHSQAPWEMHVFVSPSDSQLGAVLGLVKSLCQLQLIKCVCQQVCEAWHMHTLQVHIANYVPLTIVSCLSCSSVMFAN